MKKLFAALRRAPKRSTAIAGMLMGVLLVPAAIFAWGPDRPTYTMANPADHVTFNSITDNPTYGDEREFVTIKDVTAGGSFTNTATLIPGHTYKVQVYVHNDAAEIYNDAAHNYKGVAKNTKVRTVLPAQVNGNDTVDGFVSASNATPGTVYDTAALKSASPVNIEYVSGSAMLHTWKQQTKLSDAIFGNGVLVGSGDKTGTDLSGDWLGCIDYAGGVTYEFKVSAPANPDFTVEKTVSKHNANSWSENYDATPDETVDFRIKYSNTGNTVQENVVVQDTLPAGLTYVEGTTRLYSSQTPAEGKLLSDNVTSTGVNIGHYAADAWAYVAFSAKVANNDDLAECDENTLTNIAKVETDNGSKSDTASVTATKECEEEEEKMVDVCDADSGEIISVKESEADNYLPADSDECKPVEKNVEVCDADSGDIIIVKESEASNYLPVDSDECKDETPTTPTTPTTPDTPTTPVTELPKTGGLDVLSSVIGLGSLTAATYYYVNSRRN